MITRRTHKPGGFDDDGDQDRYEKLDIDGGCDFIDNYIDEEGGGC